MICYVWLHWCWLLCWWCFDMAYSPCVRRLVVNMYRIDPHLDSVCASCTLIWNIIIIVVVIMCFGKRKNHLLSVKLSCLISSSVCVHVSSSQCIRIPHINSNGLCTKRQHQFITFIFYVLLCVIRFVYRWKHITTSPTPHIIVPLFFPTIYFFLRIFAESARFVVLRIVHMEITNRKKTPKQLHEHWTHSFTWNAEKKTECFDCDKWFWLWKWIT